VRALILKVFDERAKARNGFLDHTWFQAYQFALPDHHGEYQDTSALQTV